MLLIALVWLVVVPAGLAVQLESLPPSTPQERVLDTAKLLSRSSSAEITRQLTALQDFDVDAHLLTVSRLDYDQGLGSLGAGLLERWPAQGTAEQLLLLIDAQTGGTAIVASSGLEERLTASLLNSTARSTFAQPLREGNRYRQASLDALARLSTVLAGQPDPGEVSLTPEIEPQPTNVPSRAETQASRAWLWITVLLVVGTLVPMLTWWVFSR